MVRIKRVIPLITELPGNQVVMTKKSFKDLVKHINLLTDTVNSLIAHQEVSEDNIKKLAKSIETLGGE